MTSKTKAMELWKKGKTKAGVIERPLANLIVEDLTPDQQTIICMAINHDGTAGPFATPVNLRFFTIDYARKCLSKAVKNNVLNDKGTKIANNLLSVWVQ